MRRPESPAVPGGFRYSIGSMRLVIARHGKAEPDSPTGRDADRRLTLRGELQAQWLGRHLLESGYSDAVVLTSQAERARRTAEILCEVLGIEPLTAPGLMLGRSAGEALHVLESYREHPSVVLVGHNPTVSELASILTRGLGGSCVGLKTGSAAMIELKGEPTPGLASLEDVIRLDD